MKNKIQKVFVIGEQGLVDEIQAQNIEAVVSDPNLSMSDAEYTTFQCDPEVKSVVVGIDTNFNYRKLCIACLYL